MRTYEKNKLLDKYQHIYAFEKLEVWQDARDLVKLIYKITSQLPSDEKFGLISQMRRCSISIVSNLAEGTGRTSSKDKSHFYQIAYSSVIELLNQVLIASDLGFINAEQVASIREEINKIAAKTAALRNATLNAKP